MVVGLLSHDLESRLSGNSFDNIKNNILMLKEMFLGGTADDALGFDDYLVEVGEQATSTKMVDAINLTIDNVESFECHWKRHYLTTTKKPKSKPYIPICKKFPR